MNNNEHNARFFVLLGLAVALCILCTPVAAANGPINIASASLAPVADFSANPTSGTAPLPVQFTDLSTGDGISAWAWDLNNDGIIDSTEQNPLYIYTTAGNYTVNLTVTGTDGNGESIKTDYITVTEPVPAPVAEFTGTPVSGDAPLTVDFTDASTGSISTYAWDFENDGIIDSTEQNPQHVYNTAGTYTVNLTVTGPGGSDNEMKTDYITVTEPVPGKVSAEIRIEPQTLNLKSSGVFTVFITLPDEYSITDIDADSLVCEGAHAKSVKAVNGTKNEYMAKFDRKDLVNVTPGNSVMFTISGNLDTDTGILEFAGNDMVRVIK